MKIESSAEKQIDVGLILLLPLPFQEGVVGLLGGIHNILQCIIQTSRKRSLGLLQNSLFCCVFDQHEIAFMARHLPLDIQQIPPRVHLIHTSFQHNSNVLFSKLPSTSDLLFSAKFLLRVLPSFLPKRWRASPSSTTPADPQSRKSGESKLWQEADL